MLHEPLRIFVLVVFVVLGAQKELVHSAPSHGRRRIDTAHKVGPMKGMVDSDEEYSRILTPRRNSSYRATQSTLDVYEADIEDHDYQHQNAHGDIIFPDSYERTRKKNTSSVTPLVRLGTTPVCAEDSTFCEDIDTYPYEQVKNALADWEEETMMDVFGADEAPTEIIANRIGELDETFVCDSFSTTVYPKAGKTKSNKWKYIINQGTEDGRVQGIRVERCQRDNSPCSIPGELNSGYITSCKQKFIYRRLLSIGENGQTSMDSFQMPSACCCSYRRDNSYLLNFGRAVTPAMTAT